MYQREVLLASEGAASRCQGDHEVAVLVLRLRELLESPDERMLTSAHGIGQYDKSLTYINTRACNKTLQVVKNLSKFSNTKSDVIAYSSGHECKQQGRHYKYAMISTRTPQP